MPVDLRIERERGRRVAQRQARPRHEPLQRIGVRDRWVDSGGIKELFTHHGMQPEDIAAAAKVAMCDKRRRSQ